jgi:hypothetical protein
MITITLEVPSEADVDELRQKPGYRIVNVATAKLEPIQPHLRRRWAGLLSDADADALRKHVEEVRNEWERDF